MSNRIRLALVLLLLVAQSISLAHEQDHFDWRESRACPTCSVNSTGDALIPVVHQVPPFIPQAPASATIPVDQSGNAPLHQHFARAPPHIS